MTRQGWPVVRTVTEVGSGLNGQRPRAHEGPRGSLRRHRGRRAAGAADALRCGGVEGCARRPRSAPCGGRSGADQGRPGHDRCADKPVCASVWPPVGPGPGGEGAAGGERGTAVTQAFGDERDPTVRQQRLLAKAAGRARYACNWGWQMCKHLLDGGKPVPQAAELHRRWHAEKPQRSWVYGVAPCCGQEARRELHRTFAHFWRGRRAGMAFASPAASPRSVSLPRTGCGRTEETTGKCRGRLRAATVSREADRW